MEVKKFSIYKSVEKFRITTDGVSHLKEKVKNFSEDVVDEITVVYDRLIDAYGQERDVAKDLIFSLNNACVSYGSDPSVYNEKEGKFPVYSNVLMWENLISILKNYVFQYGDIFRFEHNHYHTNEIGKTSAMSPKERIVYILENKLRYTDLGNLITPKMVEDAMTFISAHGDYLLDKNIRVKYYKGEIERIIGKPNSHREYIEKLISFLETIGIRVKLLRGHFPRRKYGFDDVHRLRLAVQTKMPYVRMNDFNVKFSDPMIMSRMHKKLERIQNGWATKRKVVED